jgi:uncharacterized protein (TIGR02246 family)
MTRLIASLWLLVPAIAFPDISKAIAADAAEGSAQDKASIAKNAEAFVAAFHKADAKALAAFWTPDGDYTTVTGRRMSGREEIEKVYRLFFADHKNLKVRIDSESLRFIAPDVAIEEGISEVFSSDGGPPSRARFKNIHVKKQDQWFLSSVQDSPHTPPTNAEHLRSLQWMIGEWASEPDKGKVERVAWAWTGNQNFVVGSFSTTFKSASMSGAKQWIGWDPTAQRIRSWIFDDSGAFGEGTWSRDREKWSIKTTSVLQDGKKATASFIIAPIDADTITLQVKDRSIGGRSMPDIPELKLKRVK